MDVVTLLPSATEICYALGMEPVGVSHACDAPPPARERPSVTTSAVTTTGSSRAVNTEVANAGEDGNGVYDVDREALERADPDLVVTQGVCDVCAVDDVLVTRAVGELGLAADVLTLDPHSLSDVIGSIERIGAATGRTDRADELVTELRGRVRAVNETMGTVERRPRVAVVDWMDPVMVAGHWIPGMVADAGGRYGLQEPGDRSRPQEWSTVREYDPEVLVVAPCGFGLDQATRHLSELTERPGWEELTAVADGRAYVMDGHHHVNRPGPRLVDTLEYLAALVHPERFDVPPADVVRPLGSAVAEPD